MRHKVSSWESCNLFLKSRALFVEGQWKWSGKEAIQSSTEMMSRLWDFLNKVLWSRQG